MNAIAAHKDELKKLLGNLSGDTAVSGIGFVAVPQAGAGCSAAAELRRVIHRTTTS